MNKPSASADREYYLPAELSFPIPAHGPFSHNVALILRYQPLQTSSFQPLVMRHEVRREK